MDLIEFKEKFERLQVIEFNNNTTDVPLVSVCVQTYQHAHYVSECLDGILNQITNFKFEILLGEDGSRDGTREVCVEYSKTYPDRIRLFLHHRENNIEIAGRPSGRFNMMYNLYHARGKYIAMCEGDDYWTDPLKLQKQVDILEHNLDCIACHHWQSYSYFRDNEWVIEDAPFGEREGYLPKEKSTVKDIFANKLRIKTRTVMYRNIIDEEFFPDWFRNCAFGDVPLSMLMGRYGNFYFLDEVMAVYRQTDKGVSTTGLAQMGRRKFYAEHFKKWIKIWDEADKFYNYVYQEQARATVNYFYSIIFKNTSPTIKSYLELLKFNMNRQVPASKSLTHSKLIINSLLKTQKTRVVQKLKHVRS